MAKHIHILGICGTFMGGLALMARQLGFAVSGSDQNVYPPMSTQLADAGIELFEGWDPAQLNPQPDCVIVGNALSRGNPAVEAVLDKNIPYCSGAQWLAEEVMKDRWVLAVSGTHGKTSTSSMLAWILEYAGLKPGFLIGGIPANFGLSARLGDAPFFVVEADEYDTAFFDKRSKFVHYHPRTLIMNNLEFDHADIFSDLAAIQTQFHHLVRTVPSAGLIIMPYNDAALDEVIERGCWTPMQKLATSPVSNATWCTEAQSADAHCFDVSKQGELIGRVDWGQIGEHNMANGIAAIAAAQHAGVPADVSIEALAKFKGIKRRMELRGEVAGVSVYDDFAHHPTAIKTTIAGLRGRVGDARIIAVLEPRSNTMKQGIHKHELAASLSEPDQVALFQPGGLEWDLNSVARQIGEQARVLEDIETLAGDLVDTAQAGDHILIMSNGGFGGLHERVLEGLRNR